MAESQSRYSIMDELNQRKIQEREKLANLERDKDQHEYNEEKKISALKQEIESNQKSYKQDFLDWKRQKEIALDLLRKDAARQIKQREEEISVRTDSYESDFQNWKMAKTKELDDIQENLTQYLKKQANKIEEKQEILKEIENGIADLKEMSQESSSKGKD